jgi:hypothetical protein
VRLEVIPRLRCPACLPTGASSDLELDPTRLGGADDGGTPGDVLEGYLVCRRCRDVRLVLGGLGVLPRDLRRHFATHGNVYARIPIGDPRVTRFVFGMAADGVDHVPFEEVVLHYGDLVPYAPGRAAPRPGAASDLFLDAALRDARAEGPALDVGCGVGRGTFVLAARCGEAVGVDRSVARLRRARNVQTAEEFRLPLSDDDDARTAAGEVPIDLARLERGRVDFAVADATLLPFADGSFGTVVFRLGDGEGAWASPAAALASARRVVAPGGALLIEEAPSKPGDIGVFRVARVPARASAPR